MTEDGELAFYSNVPKTELELNEWQLQKAALAREQRAQEIRELQAAEGSIRSGSEEDLQRQRNLQKLQELEIASLKRAEPPTGETGLTAASGVGDVSGIDCGLMTQSSPILGTDCGLVSRPLYYTLRKCGPCDGHQCWCR